jgi:type VI secretion system secreted protein VgrG
MVLFNHTVNLKPNAADIIRYHRDAATEERDTITSWCAVRTLQPGKVTRYSWDYKQPWNEEFMTTSAQSAMDQGESGNEMSASLDDYQVLAPHAGDDYDDLCLLGQLAMNRHDMDSKCFQGEGSVRDMCVGEYFTLEGHPEIDGHARSECEFVVTSMRLAIFNNLPKELAGRVERLFASNHWTQGSDQFLSDAGKFSTRVRVSFNAVRRGIPIVPAYDARSETPVTPMQSAMVVGPEGEEVHCDELGRVKICFITTRASDHEHAQGAGASDSDVDSAWVRVASCWAGNGPGSSNQFGSLYLPRVGSEVLVAFLGGDPDKPIIVGQTYNQRGQPPAISQGGGLPGNRYISGLRSREVRGNQANHLRFDDSTGETSAQLACDQTGAQLNLGFITHDRANGAGEKRGEGAELSTHQAVSIRGEAGVLVSAASFANRERKVLDREPCLGAASLAHNVYQHLAEVAAKASEDSETEDSLGNLVNRLEQWGDGGGEPIVAISARNGIVAGSADAIVLGSQSDIHLDSGRDTNIGAGGNLFARAAKGVSILACKLGIKLIAASGDIKVQSQNGCIEISTSKQIKLVANEKIELHSPAIKLVAQGTQIDCGGGKITQQSSSSHTIKSSKFEHQSGGDGSPEKVDMPSIEVEHDQQILVSDLQSDEPVPDRKYRITVEDGQVIEGQTDKNGLTERFKTKTAFARYDIEFLE